MNTDRPNYEALYRVAYRKHHELLNEIEDLIDQWSRCMAMTGSDVVGQIRLIHEKYITHDWSH